MCAVHASPCKTVDGLPASEAQRSLLSSLVPFESGAGRDCTNDTDPRAITRNRCVRPNQTHIPSLDRRSIAPQISARAAGPGASDLRASPGGAQGMLEESTAARIEPYATPKPEGGLALVCDRHGKFAQVSLLPCRPCVEWCITSFRRVEENAPGPRVAERITACWAGSPAGPTRFCSIPLLASDRCRTAKSTLLPRPPS